MKCTLSCEGGNFNPWADMAMSQLSVLGAPVGQLSPENFRNPIPANVGGKRALGMSAGREALS